MFKEFAQNVKLMKLIMNTVKPVILLLAQESMSSSQNQPKPVSVNLNMSRSEESAPTVILDNTMTHTQINVFVNQDIENIKVTVKLFAPEELPISMESACAPTVCPFIKENVKILHTVLFTLIGIRELNVVSVTPDTESSMENAAVINIVESTDIFNMVNATAMMDTSGS